MAKYDSISLYLKALGKEPLLTKDEERKLGYRIREGDESAKRELVERNWRLSASIAKRYGRGDDHFLDLVQAGIFGLYEAAKRFDPDKGTKFSTYATQWVRQKIGRALNNYEAGNDTSLRIPVHMVERLRKARKLSDSHYVKTGKRLSIEEQSEAICRIEEEGEKLNGKKPKKRTTTRREKGIDLAHADLISHKHSLEDALRLKDNDTGSQTLSEIKVVESSPPTVFLNEMGEFTEELISKLPERMQVVIKSRYYKGKTLEDTRKGIGISRERVRQIEEEAKKELKKILIRKHGSNIKLSDLF